MRPWVPSAAYNARLDLSRAIQNGSPASFNASRPHNVEPLNVSAELEDPSMTTRCSASSKLLPPVNPQPLDLTSPWPLALGKSSHSPVPCLLMKQNDSRLCSSMETEIPSDTFGSVNVR